MRSRWVGCTRAANKDQRAKRERQGNRNAHSARAGAKTRAEPAIAVAAALAGSNGVCHWRGAMRSLVCMPPSRLSPTCTACSCSAVESWVGSHAQKTGPPAYTFLAVGGPRSGQSRDGLCGCTQWRPVVQRGRWAGRRAAPAACHRASVKSVQPKVHTRPSTITMVFIACATIIEEKRLGSRLQNSKSTRTGLLQIFHSERFRAPVRRRRVHRPIPRSQGIGTRIVFHRYGTGTRLRQMSCWAPRPHRDPGKLCLIFIFSLNLHAILKFV
jgi:hypothetical protein